MDRVKLLENYMSENNIGFNKGNNQQQGNHNITSEYEINLNKKPVSHIQKTKPSKKRFHLD